MGPAEVDTMAQCDPSLHLFLTVFIKCQLLSLVLLFPQSYSGPADQTQPE